MIDDTDKLDLSLLDLLNILSSYLSDSLLEQVREDLIEKQLEVN